MRCPPVMRATMKEMTFCRVSGQKSSETFVRDNSPRCRGRASTAPAPPPAAAGIQPVMDLAIEGEDAAGKSRHDEKERHEQPGVAMSQYPETTRHDRLLLLHVTMANTQFGSTQ